VRFVRKIIVAKIIGNFARRDTYLKIQKKKMTEKKKYWNDYRKYRERESEIRQLKLAILRNEYIYRR